MKKLIFLVLFLLPMALQAQYLGVFGSRQAPQDTAIMISNGADTLLSYTIPAITSTGSSALWVAAYSNFDGISILVTIRYRIKMGVDDLGGNRWSVWTTLATLLTTEDTSVQYGSGDQIGVTYDMSSMANPWQRHSDLEFLFTWTTVAADTLELQAVYTR